MKKLLAVLVSVVTILLNVTVLAQADNQIEGIIKGNAITFACDGENGSVATLTIFDDGKMCASKTVKAEDGVYSFALTEDEKNKSMRVHFYGENGYDVVVKEEPEITPAPEVTPAPEANKYPPTYEKALDAIHAPSVVNGVSAVVIDDEAYCELKILYQGREIIINVREKVLISSAPINAPEMVGKTADYLCEGDVIHITSDMQGRAKKIDLIYRPEFVNYYGDGISDAGIIGFDGYNDYCFGVVVDKYNDAVDIADGDGNIESYDVSPDAIIYTVTKGRKYNYAQVTSTNGVKALAYTRIPDSNYIGDCISWDGMEELSYVLMRGVRDVITEIIIFE